MSKFFKLVPVFLASAGLALANIAGFDDLSAFVSVPNGYAGVGHWDNFYTLDAPNYSINPSGYLNGMVSSPNVLFNSNANDAQIWDTTAFDLNSGYFTAAWNDGLQLQITGYNGATLLYDNTFTLNTSGPSYLNLNYLGVTFVNFHSYGGTDNPNMGGAGEHFASDNITINGHGVPDTGVTFALFGAALAGLALARRRVA